MKKHISFPAIEQFRTVIANVNRQFNFTGLDENGDPMYNPSLPKPTLTFTGTVKLHGTNSSVCFNAEEGLWAQSRESIITPQNDNMGFALFVEKNKNEFISLMTIVKEKLNLNMRENTISIYGEWVGKGIQKGVGIANLEKSFFIFGVKITPHIDFSDPIALKNNPAYWVDHTTLKKADINIFNINDYKTYSIDIDFNMPQLIQNQLSEYTKEVERECPVAKVFEFEGIGEGIVWSAKLHNNIYRFKVKGEKHSSSRVTTLAAVDTEKLKSISDFVDYAITESRFNQGLENIFPNNAPKTVEKMGDLIRWVVNDVWKEELDTITKNSFEPKEINKYLSTRVRNMFFKTEE
jgi:hypothetical protein